MISKPGIRMFNEEAKFRDFLTATGICLGLFDTSTDEELKEDPAIAQAMASLLRAAMKYLISTEEHSNIFEIAYSNARLDITNRIDKEKMPKKMAT